MFHTPHVPIFFEGILKTFFFRGNGIRYRDILLCVVNVVRGILEVAMTQHISESACLYCCFFTAWMGTCNDAQNTTYGTTRGQLQTIL